MRRPSTFSRLARRLFTPVVVAFACLYFLIDAVSLSIIKPVVAWVARAPLFDRVAAWVASLGPYSSLALFLVPVAILEPIKPVGAYLIGSGRAFDGVLLIVAGEVLKITLVERLFHLSRDKLMSFRAFAWSYRLIASWLLRLQALPAWQVASSLARQIKATARKLMSIARGRV